MSGLPSSGDYESAVFDPRRAEGVLTSLNKSFLESTPETAGAVETTGGWVPVDSQLHHV
jgi:hypothetical protein